MGGIDGLGIAAYSYMSQNEEIRNLKDKIKELEKELKKSKSKIKRLENKVMKYKIGEKKDWK